MNVTHGHFGGHFGRRRWRDLPAGVRRRTAVAAFVQVALLAGATLGLIPRPASHVHGGRKWPWFPVLLVNPVGPLAYLVLGRKRPPPRLP